jgi:hypothetical protein
LLLLDHPARHDLADAGVSDLRFAICDLRFAICDWFRIGRKLKHLELSMAA